MTSGAVTDKVTDATNDSGLECGLFYISLFKEQEALLQEDLSGE